MSTRTSRTMTAALALALAVGLTACGSDEEAGDGVTVGSPSASETTTDATTPVTDDADEADDADDTDDDTGTSDDDGTGSSHASGSADVTAAALEAVATAEAEAGGTAYAVDDQDDDGGWEVDVATADRSVEVTVSADGLTVVGTEEDDLDDDDRAVVEAAETTLREAVEAAVAEVGGVLDDAELDEEDGSPVWEVTLDRTDGGDDDVDVRVDAVTGDVSRDDS